MKRILLISNSFGVDATRYLYGIARAAGEDAKIATLYIGGCSLYRHYRNMISGERAYTLYFNGSSTGFSVSLSEALLSDEWDVVTLQQNSASSGDTDTYVPFLKELADYVKKCVPKAQLYLHKTWAYSGDDAYARKIHSAGFETREDMLSAVYESYSDAEEMVDFHQVIPSFDAMNMLYDEVGEDTYRDGFHASFGIGRYTLACVWFETIFKKSVEGNTFCDFDVPISEDDVILAQKIAHDAVECGTYHFDD